MSPECGFVGSFFYKGFFMAFFQAVQTYSQMREVIKAFAAPESKLSFVAVKGDPGIGKTGTFRKEVPDAFVLECNTTPFGLYTGLYEHRDAGVLILDDVDTLAKSQIGLNLLKALCQTDGTKTVSWNTQAADRANIPRSFLTKARVLLLCNVLDGKGGNFEAVLDRAHCIHFRPTAAEVHGEVHSWHGDAAIASEVYAYIGGNLDRILKPTFRDYVKATQLRTAGLDWRAMLKARWDEDPKLSAAAEIVRLAQRGESAYATAEQRAKKFEDWGHGARSTYMLYQQQVLDMLGLPRLKKAKKAKAMPAPRESSDFETLAVKKSESPKVVETLIDFGN
jgi:hypothetical protein